MLDSDGFQNALASSSTLSYLQKQKPSLLIHGSLPRCAAIHLFMDLMALAPDIIANLRFCTVVLSFMS